MKQSPELQPRRSIEQRLHVSLRRLHDETGTATYASLSCPANFRAPTLPVFMLIAEGDGAVTSLRISRDLNRDVESYRIHIREHRLDGLQKCSDWIDEEHVRTLLLNNHQAYELFIHPSPGGGLLVAPGVSHDRLVRTCRNAGVELEGGQAAPKLRAKKKSH